MPSGSKTQVRVLIVDDSAAMREAIVSTLRGVADGIVVGQAANGLEGVEQARALRPNLVVLDNHMPVMGGLEALRMLKKELPCTRVLMVTSMLEHDFREEAMKLGAMDCIQKGDFLWEGLREIVLKLFQDLPGQPSGR